MEYMGSFLRKAATTNLFNSIKKKEGTKQSHVIEQRKSTHNILTSKTIGLNFEDEELYLYIISSLFFFFFLKQCIKPLLILFICINRY
ncbi:BEM_HP_G0053870.mRNA.1.CDS.1 [Saccharomyces cerevisiae]|nr:BEM_HP_G0053870.mRNA.1.CDS.1 [Saccharomyces cerevisiae]CAI6965334.1 BEM_HP_G0053870.mRNA.1.CDS.1 [Saccharomyces cerevisiae]